MGAWVYTQKASQAQPVDTGYKYNYLPDIAPSDTDRSGYLQNQVGSTLNLWITDVKADFAMQGTTGQSAWKRTFFPHNFSQPTMTVTGVVPNNKQLGLLGEFIRETQLYALNAPGFDPGPNIDVIFVLEQRSNKIAFRGAKAEATITGQAQMRDQKTKFNLRGYVPSFTRGARQFEFAQEYQFQFIVNAGTMGDPVMLNDTADTPAKLLSWTQIWPSHVGGSNSPFVADPGNGTPLGSSSSPPPLAGGALGQTGGATQVAPNGKTTHQVVPGLPNGVGNQIANPPK